MTEQEHAEISRRLALAIGWEDWQVQTSQHGTMVFIMTDHESLTGPARYRVFDYRAFDVIWPIAERFEAFPRRPVMGGPWLCRTSSLYAFSLGETAAPAVARAVIAAKEKA